MTDQDPKTTPAEPWPEGYRQLSTEEAVRSILLGEHRGAASFEQDEALINLLRLGSAVAALPPDESELTYKATKAAMTGEDLKKGGKRGEEEEQA